MHSVPDVQVYYRGIDPTLFRHGAEKLVVHSRAKAKGNQKTCRATAVVTGDLTDPCTAERLMAENGPLHWCWTLPCKLPSVAKISKNTNHGAFILPRLWRSFHCRYHHHGEDRR